MTDAVSMSVQVKATLGLRSVTLQSVLNFLLSLHPSLVLLSLSRPITFPPSPLSGLMTKVLWFFA